MEALALAFLFGILTGVVGLVGVMLYIVATKDSNEGFISKP